MSFTASTALVVDDESQIRRVVKNAIADDFSRIIDAASGRHAIDLAATEHPALVILDLGLPDMSGIDVCREIRQWSSAPIVVLSARHAETERMTLLDAGADDYIIKPFSAVEFQGRIRAILRRANPEIGVPTRIEFGDIILDLSARTLTRRGKSVHLTPTEWKLLHVFAMQPGKVLTHQQLFSTVWAGRHYGDAQQYLRVYVASLRRKIEEDSLKPCYIITEPGVGYRFDPSY
jgi:two-component system KDP operon response regulator KdpE